MAWGYDGYGFGEGDCLLGVRSRTTGIRTTPGLYSAPRLGLNDPTGYNRFWSLHSNGANWALADGSVRFIAYAAGTTVATQVNGINVTLLECMASIAGGEVFNLD